jgi:hypothetical protein
MTAAVLVALWLIARRAPGSCEFVPGYAADTWCGIGAPNAMPPAIIQTLNKEINAGLLDPKIKPRPAELDGMGLAGSPPNFGKLLAEETKK